MAVHDSKWAKLSDNEKRNRFMAISFDLKKEQKANAELKARIKELEERIAASAVNEENVWGTHSYDWRKDCDGQ